MLFVSLICFLISVTLVLFKQGQITLFNSYKLTKNWISETQKQA